MRLRQLLAWTVVPCALVALVAGAFLAQAVGGERARAANLAQGALAGDALEDATAWVYAKTTALMTLDAFAARPVELQIYETGATAMRTSMDRSLLLTNLDNTDASGAAALRRLEAAGVRDAAIAAVLAPLDRDVRDALGAGRTGLIDPTPHVDAIAVVQQRQRTSSAEAKLASDELLDLASGPPYWRGRSFVIAALALVSLALLAGLVGAWRLSTGAARLRRAFEDESADAATHRARSDRLHAVLGTARRIAAGRDVAAVQQTLVHETRALLHDAGVALYLRTATGFAPAVQEGVAMVGVGANEGIVGRCVESAATERAVLARDPAIPAIGDACALLVAPLVSEGQVFGALVAVRPGTVLFDDNDETVLQMLALVAANALRAAERYDSTVALTLHDPLTGLANRRRLDADLQALTTGTGAVDRVAFLMVDIDHFKQFNDEYGHPTGDELLRRVARTIAAAVRAVDVVYRYGGEEFSVLLPDATAEEAQLVAERVRSSVAAAPVPAGGGVTVSVGLAASDRNGTGLDLLAAADAALYDAKHAGRNRVARAATGAR